MQYRAIAAALALAFASHLASASAECPAYPKAEWMKESDARAKLEKDGYKIKKFKVSGNCYEIYGHDKAGKKVEIYFDAKTLAIIKQGD
ncbi:PepSY domain-containing protein [Chitinimonas naiadis]